MDFCLSFYTTLFALEIAVFGILAAAILVFVQIVQNKFSHREIGFIFRNYLFVSFSILSILVTVLNAFFLVILAFPAHDFIPAYNFGLDLIVQSPYVGFLLMFLFLLSLLLFIVLMFKNLSFINPTRVALLITSNMSVENIRNFLLKTYGVSNPLYVSYRQHSIVFPDQVENYIDENGCTILPQEFQAKAKDKRNSFSEEYKEYERILNTVENVTDPFRSIDGLVIQTINSPDLRSIEEIFKAFSDLLARIVDSCPDKIDEEIWDPNHDIPGKMINHIMYLYKIYFDMSDRLGLETFKHAILKSSKEILFSVIDRGNNYEIITVLKFWKDCADQSIGSSPEIFKEIILNYELAAKSAFVNESKVKSAWLDELFRSVGWLGERLLNKEELEVKPIMHDDEYYREYDALLNSLSEFRWEFEKFPNTYPLVYFDAVYVVLRAISAVYQRLEYRELSEDIWYCLKIFSSFSKTAAINGNHNGASLGAVKLINSLDLFIERNMLRTAREAAKLMVAVGVTVAGSRDKLIERSFLTEPLEAYLLNKLRKLPPGVDIQSELIEQRIQAFGTKLNSDYIDQFIDELSV